MDLGAAEAGLRRHPEPVARQVERALRGLDADLRDELGGRAAGLGPEDARELARAHTQPPHQGPHREIGRGMLDRVYRVSAVRSAMCVASSARRSMTSLRYGMVLPVSSPPNHDLHRGRKTVTERPKAAFRRR